MYTLHVKKDGVFDLYIDTEVVSSGSLLEDMTPPLVPPMEIDDPEDEQPEDWVTEVHSTAGCRCGGGGRYGLRMMLPHPDSGFVVVAVAIFGVVVDEDGQECCSQEKGVSCCCCARVPCRCREAVPYFS